MLTKKISQQSYIKLVSMVFLILLLGTSNTKAQSDEFGVYQFSSELQPGDSFAWTVSNTGFLDEAEDEYFQDGTITTLDILQNPTDLDFTNFRDYSQYFALKFNETPYNFEFEWDDIFYFFVFPTINELNGEITNPTETNYICAVLDDICFDELEYGVSINGNIVSYQAMFVPEFEEETEEDVGIDLFVQIDRTTGIMLVIDARIIDDNFDQYLVIQQVGYSYLRSLDQTSDLSSLRLNPVYFVFALSLLVILKIHVRRPFN